MCAIRSYRLRSLRDQQVGRSTEGSGSIYQVVDNDNILPIDIADDLHACNGIRLQALLVDHHHVGVPEILLVQLDPFDAPEVRAAQTEIGKILLSNVIEK